ncbi:glycoside hydrolase family 18 [Thermaerobacter sp. PB12/4term]|nr:glycoside hydrolase family 18 [Thermaerobacter sp. PB12/4term]
MPVTPGGVPFHSYDTMPRGARLNGPSLMAILRPESEVRAMRNRAWVWVLVAVLVGAGIWMAAGGDRNPVAKPRADRSNDNLQLPAKPAPRAKVPGQLFILGFYDETEEARGEDILATLRRHRNQIEYLSPFWYSVRADGSIVDRSDRDLRDFAARENIKLMPLFNNHEGTDAFLHDAGARRRAVTNIVHLVRQHGYGGVQIDFQLLEPQSRQELTTFLRELRQALPEDKAITVSVIPHRHQEDSAQHSKDAYSYKGLAQYARIVLMAYDRHGELTGPGPVSPLDWVGEVVAAAREDGVPADKIWLGIPAYGYDWAENRDRATPVPLREVRTLTRQRDIQVQRNEDGIPHFTYVDERGVRHTVWYEDEVSVARKVRLARRHNLYGVAIWRLGYEDEPYWRMLLRETGRTGMDMTPDRNRQRESENKDPDADPGEIQEGHPGNDPDGNGGT